MPRTPIFLSFEYKPDVFRVMQVRNMGMIEDKPLLSAQEWETLERAGKWAVQRWIDHQMQYKRCVVVLAGTNTYSREWVKYEIRKAVEDRRAIFGIYIHNLKDPRTGVSAQGRNPFDSIIVNGVPLSHRIPCYNPNPANAYQDIELNMQRWIDAALANR